jgi:hypothetical protein
MSPWTSRRLRGRRRVTSRVISDAPDYGCYAAIRGEPHPLGQDHQPAEAYWLRLTRQDNPQVRHLATTPASNKRSSPAAGSVTVSLPRSRIFTPARTIWRSGVGVATAALAASASAAAGPLVRA